jgi:ABC-2 type transport system ATP-binding protein
VETILRTEGVHKSYAAHKALDDINLSIPRQSVFGLLGPNGAGKSTLIRIINQIIFADAGRITINGEDLHPKHIRQIGYLPEERGLYKKMKVGEQLLYLAQLRGLSTADAKKRLKYWLEKFEAADWWNKKVEDLSKGMGQKIQFISTVMHEPELIILDEPFSGFDPVNANLIKNEILSLRDKGSTIIFSTHRMESVEELCDNIALINRSKKILDGPKKQIKDSFKSNTFEVSFNGQLGVLNNCDLVSERQDAELTVSRIRVNNDMSPNELLKMLINQVEVHAFNEIVPTMNDIFIKMVQDRGEEVPQEMTESTNLN